jgi:2-hydroxycyclohexanecarboxyl-CoA dehydrogenase
MELAAVGNNNAGDVTMDLGLGGKVAVVTGAGGGVGRQIAIEFAREGAIVVINDVTEAGLAETALLVEAGGGKAVQSKTDVTDREAVQRMFAEVERDVGPVAVLVNNAAVISQITPFVQSDPALSQRDIEVGLFGTMHCTRAALPAMIARGAGKIVCVASDAGRAGNGTLASYSATKGGVIAFMKAIAQEVGPQGINVNAVSPGSTRAPMRDQVLQSIGARDGDAGVQQREAARTAQIPMRRVGEPEDVAYAVLFLASGQARHITGQVLSVNGGFRMY